MTLYVPQVDNWDGVTLEFRSAVSLRPKTDVPPVYGVVWGTTQTSVDKDARVVHLLDRQFTKAVFPRRPTRPTRGSRCSRRRSSRPSR